MKRLSCCWSIYFNLSREETLELLLSGESKQDQMGFVKLEREHILALAAIHCQEPGPDNASISAGKLPVHMLEFAKPER